MNQVIMLESISLDCHPILNEWVNKFELLQQFKSISGNTHVPQLYSTQEGVKLGIWVTSKCTVNHETRLSTN